MCLTGAAEAQIGRLKGRGKSLAQVARVQSGCSRLESASFASPCGVVFVVLLVDADGVCVLSVLQELPCR